jgi:flagellar M-ring protein FliF
MVEFWEGLSNWVRSSLVAGIFLIVIAIFGFGWWFVRADYQVLFSDLKPQDLSVMTTELEKQKIPYRVSDDNLSILVDKALVHSTRLKLMGKELPLNGAVGFELFNNTDFGMTEFAQKINYQRALQGELTRTILSIAEVKDVRVHLAMPDQGLFKQSTNKAKAAITVTLRSGQLLRPEQITGIQGLVAAATPNLHAKDVSVSDHQGVILSRVAHDASSDGSISLGGSARNELKRETEAYLTRKVNMVLDGALGPGLAVASVDVTLNMDVIRTTTEDVIPAPNQGKQPHVGVIVREKEFSRDSGSVPSDAKDAGIGRPGSVQREVEYQVGRRIEQVINQPGSIRRLQAVAVVRKNLDRIQEDQLNKLVAGAVGFSVDRGDTVVIQIMPQITVSEANGIESSNNPKPINNSKASNDFRSNQSLIGANWISHIPSVVLWIGGTLLIFLVSTLIFLINKTGQTLPSSAATLSEAEKKMLVKEIRAWMDQDSMDIAKKV